MCRSRLVLSALLVVFITHQRPVCSAVDSRFEDIVFLNSTFITNTCETGCQGSQKEHCQRGCRFFDSAASVLSPFNDTLAATLACQHSCAEAYDQRPTLKWDCVNGCDRAEKEFIQMYKMSLQWLDEAEKKMGFFQSLFDWSTSILWPSVVTDFPLPRSPCYVPRDASKQKVKIPIQSHSSRQSSMGTKSYIVSAVVPGKTISNYSASERKDGKSHDGRGWIYYTSYILLTIGTLSLIFITGYYVMAIRKYKEITKELADDSEPPSYENVIKEAHVLIEGGHQFSQQTQMSASDATYLPVPVDAPPAYSDLPQRV